MNDGNLIRPEDLTPSERRENARKAGKASGAARRRKRDLKAALNELLNMDIVCPDILDNTIEMGVTDSMDYHAAVVAGLVRKAAGGDVAAFKEIRNLLGEDNDAERLRLQKKELALREKKLGEGEETGEVKIIDDVG